MGEEEQRQPTEGVIVFAVSYNWKANRSADSGSTPSSIWRKPKAQREANGHTGLGEPVRGVRCLRINILYGP